MADDMVADPIEPETAATPTPEVAPPAGAAPAAEPRFVVPLSVVLEESQVPLARLQGLQEGAVLPLGASAGSIPVKLLAGGRALATGTLVAIGDGYGVLIDAVDAEG